jgi:hypothetical protein
MIWVLIAAPELAPIGTSTLLATPHAAFPGVENSLRPQLMESAVPVKVVPNAEVMADHLVVQPAAPLQLESAEML